MKIIIGDVDEHNGDDDDSYDGDDDNDYCYMIIFISHQLV